jgi:NAD(P)-dependent dehydrogenase (short-subunit alcohol dehydrogenase family)
MERGAEISAGLFSVEGKRVLITGATSGIGEMMARGFVAAGADVLVVSRKQEMVERVVEELSTIGKCAGLAADLAAGGVEQVVAELRDQRRPLDVLINNAGSTWGAPLENYPSEAFDKVMALNVRATFELTVGVRDLLAQSATPENPSRVISIGSIEGIVVPEWENYAYPASKAAVHMLTRQLAKKLASENITVNALAPGPFPSRMIAFAQDDAALWAEIERSIPLRRSGREADICGPAIFLASRAGAYLTGTVIPVDGGLVGAGVNREQGS